METVDFGGDPLSSAGGADVFLTKHSASGTLLWAMGFGGAADDVAYAAAPDITGNVVIAGYFQGSVSFGGATLTSAGSYDIFVAKYSPAGAHLWSRRFGGTSGDAAYGVAVDEAGDVALTGFFQGNVSFGGTTLNSTYGGIDSFVAKLSGADGSPVWSKSFLAPSPDFGNAIAVDHDGDVVVAGAFQGTEDFGGGTLTSAGASDVFVARYSAGGSHLWSQSHGGPGSDSANAVAVDEAGNVLVSGSFHQTVDFGGGPLTSAGGADAFIAARLPDGSHLWSRKLGGTGADIAYGIATDRDGNPVVTGFFQGTVDFGGGPLTSAGWEDVFAAGFTPTGAHRWSRAFGGSSTEYGNGVVFAPDDVPTVIGFFYGSVDFGGGPLTSAGAQDVFLLRLEP